MDSLPQKVKIAFSETVTLSGFLIKGVNVMREPFEYLLQLQPPRQYGLFFEAMANKEGETLDDRDYIFNGAIYVARSAVEKVLTSDGEDITQMLDIKEPYVQKELIEGNILLFKEGIVCMGSKDSQYGDVYSLSAGDKKVFGYSPSLVEREIRLPADLVKNVEIIKPSWVD